MRRAELNPDTEPEERPLREAPDERAVLLVSSLRARAPIPLPAAGAVTIGRGPPAAAADGDGAGAGALVRLPDSLLSREHLRISDSEGRREIEDLSSRNGTFLDGHRLTGPKRLSEGAIVLFGNQVAVYRQVTAPELQDLRREAEAPFGPVPTFHPALARTYARLRKLARTDNEVLLVGEAGVGKELCARAIHRASGRTGPFVSVNCAALSPAMVESELYGFVPGKAGGNAKRGLIETAEGGTVLLEEIGQMPPELQAKIFRFLQDRTIRPLGRVRPRRVDVRVVATATHVGTALGSDGLRPDLVARLGTEAVTLPPLRRRPEEVPFLVAHFGGEAIREVEPAALRALALYGWPLNVRELERTIANATTMSIAGHLRLEHLPNVVRAALERGAPVEARRRPPREAPERADLEQLLQQHEGNVASVARALDRKWNVVQRWLARYKLQASRFRKG